MLAPGLGIAVAICPACTARAIDRDGSADTLIAEIRDQYSAGVTFARPSEVPATASPSITLRRRGIGAHPRRHPDYGKSLAENPPPADEPLNIALGWPNAKNLPAPLLVVQPEDNPARLRFDVADGRRVRVAHPSNADPDRLLWGTDFGFTFANCIDYRRELLERARVDDSLKERIFGVNPLRLIERHVPRR